MKLFLLALAIITHSVVYTQTNISLMHNGVNRDFVYYTPSSWTPTESLPVLFVLHGLTQTGSGLMDITSFNDIAEANNFIVCYPDGINGAWNADMNVTASQADDIGFLEELAVYMQNNLNTNPAKQYLTGFSNGGFMSYKMLCESSQCYAAVATISSTMSDLVYQNCNPQNNTDILHIHGTLDGIVSYFGSPTTGISVETLMETWSAYYNCDLSPNITPMPNPSFLDMSHPEKHTYTNCNNTSLEHIKITGGGHQWPGILTIWGGLGTINMDFYAPQVIWDFLDGKSCDQTSGLSDNSNNAQKTLIKIVDLIGRETEKKYNTPLIFVYSNGTREKVIILK
ncbi:MAG: alpha/beta hydrolase-fold protein [Crocinitomicaceae bacterium]|nr:alpha/beta hydrolase-fold protein [Crocinitomicaceae bacterium]